MSAYNSNYSPANAPYGNQGNLVNGLPGAPPPPSQQQQLQQQQQTYQQPQYPQHYLQQQQVLQQKQQLQQPQQQLPYQVNANPNAPPPHFNSNVVNKYMPPSSNASPLPPTSLAEMQRPPNGPPLLPSNLYSQSPLSNLPLHLRPPTQNGPGSTQQQTVVTNGSNGAMSANSSRTGSPGAPSPLPKPQCPAACRGPQQQVPPVTATTSPVTNLTSNMQDLNLNGSNGGATPTHTPQPTERDPVERLPPSKAQYKHFHGVALGDMAAIADPNKEANSAKTAPPTASYLESNPSYTSRQYYPIPNPFSASAPISQTPASVFGGPTAPKLSQKPLGQTDRIQYGVQMPAMTNPASGARSPSLKNATSSAAAQLSSGAAQPNSTAVMGQRPPMPNQSPMTIVPPKPVIPPPPTMFEKPTPPVPSQVVSAPQSFMQPTHQPPTLKAPPQATPIAPPMMAQQQQQQQLQAQPPQAPLKYQYPQSYPQPPQPYQPGQAQSTPLVFGAQPLNAPLQYQAQPPAQGYTANAPAAQQFGPPLSVTQQGFSRLWGQDTIDLMQNRHILSPATIPPPKVVLHNQFHESINCSPSIMRCTLAKIPESNSLLQKSRLPLGIVVHPFRDVNSLPVIQCINIVRCRLCRTYINPFVYFVDSKMWKCNLCYRVNDLPEDFQFDPATKTYGDVTRRPEVRSSTIEFIAPSEYMLRPPQPAMYLFLFDVSIIAQQSGYLEAACSVLNRHLDEMPGDARTQVGFICFDSYVHFYSMAEGFNQPREMTLLDIDEPFLPRPDNLLVNLKECKELIRDLLNQLPNRFANTHDPGSSLGSALQVAFKLMQSSGGRITVFQSCLPNKGPGALEPREDPNNRSSKDVAHLNPATDFYKRFALECSGYQVAVDLFLMNQQYSDMATVSGVSKHSGGCVHHFPLYQKTRQHQVDSFRHCFKRYLTRKIGFEAVMRIRCTRGLQVHTFHGNFFVRSTDLLSLPNVNPDAGYGMQISYEESLTDVKTICFQAALLYTNSEGERRIRVHTICLPVTASLPEVMHSADTEAIIGLLSKMAVDRSITSNLSDARDAFINATIDIFNAFKIAQNLPSGQTGQLIAPRSLALLPLYILALLKHPAFRVGTSTRLDDRVHAMDSMKTLPLDQLMKYIYPELYKIDALIYHARNSNVSTTQDDDDDDEDLLPDMQRLQLSAEHLDSRSIFLMDCGTLIMLYVGLNVPVDVLETVLGITSTAELGDYVYGLPNVVSVENDILKRFILRLNYDKPYAPLIQIIRDTSTAKAQFIERLTDDRSESSLSYYEFLQHIRAQVK